MDIVLYTTGCPNCKRLEARLDANNISYKVVDDEKLMVEKGFTSAPFLEVNGATYSYGEAMRMLKEGAWKYI